VQGRVEGEGGVIREVILEHMLFGIGLILMRYEGDHLVECCCFHSYVFRQNNIAPALL